MDEFLSALFGAKEVKVSAREKRGNETRTVQLLGRVPADTSDESFIDAAREGGVNLSVKVAKSEDRSKNYNGKGVHGAAATKATASVLGFVPVPAPVAERAKPVEPSQPDGAAAPGKNGKGK